MASWLQLASPAFAGGYDGFGVAAMPARRGAGPAAYPTRVREQQLVAEPNRRCDAGPVNRYVLIKTHKTGGSTLANILHRRTWRYKLRPVTSPGPLRPAASLLCRLWTTLVPSPRSFSLPPVCW